jgi:hypothetical protein
MPRLAPPGLSGGTGARTRVWVGGWLYDSYPVAWFGASPFFSSPQPAHSTHSRSPSSRTSEGTRATPKTTAQPQKTRASTLRGGGERHSPHLGGLAAEQPTQGHSFVQHSQPHSSMRPFYLRGVVGRQ